MANEKDSAAGADDGGFAEFAAAGEVEVGSTKDAIESNASEPEKVADEKTAKPTKAAKAKASEKKPDEKPDEKPAEAAEGEGEGEAEGEEETEGEKAEKPKPKASDRIRELSARNRSQGRLIEQLSTRLEAIEKGGLPAGGKGGNDTGTGRQAPDPLAKDASGNLVYPLGHLDDRYIEDKLDWLAEDKAAKRADAVLQRQQETEQAQATERAQAVLLEQVEDLSTHGAELYDDFQESVVEAGIRGDWKLGQSTFEAAHEADNGAQILYELSQDKKEAARVASLSPVQQVKFVIARDAEITSDLKPRTKPKAGAPPSTQTKGANSSHRINPATDDLDQFSKAWAADAKGG